MTKISSGLTWFNKWVFPAFWFGGLALFLIIGVFAVAAKQSLMFVVIPVVMAAFGAFLMKHLVWDLLDEVYDCGDSLLVRNRGKEDKVSLANVMNVSASTNMSPCRITLRLVNPSKFGSEIAFCPVTRFALNPFAKNPIAEDLIVRVDSARSRRAV